MGGLREEVEEFYGVYSVFFGEDFHVAGFGRGVAGEVDDFFGGDGEEAGQELLVTAGARGVEDDGFVLFDFVEGFFGFFKERGGVIAGFTVIF